MMKKRTLAAVCLIALLSALLSGCGGAEATAYKDGVYTGQSGADENGAYGEVTVTVEGGRISGCEFVTWQKDGTIKGEDYGKVNGEISNQDYYDKAQLAVEAMTQYARQLPEVQRPEDVDAVSGATNSYDQFLEAVANALEGAE
jgi:major membrane immunogen (membrane-anchored lipoprotein)